MTTIKTIDKTREVCYNGLIYPEPTPRTLSQFSKKHQFSKKSKPGFTIIEFSIAIAFISMLLIAIAVVASNIITIYQKGLTLKAVNSVGRGLVEELTNAINSAPAVDSVSLCNSHISDASAQSDCIADHAQRFVYLQKLGTKSFPGGEGSETVQVAGIFCTGKYSYLWNTFYSDNHNSITLTYSNAGGATTKSNFRLIRVEDPSYRVCSNRLDDYDDMMGAGITGTTNIDITRLANGRPNSTPEPVEGFLTAFDLDLELYELTMFPLSQDNVTLRTFMTGTFVLATKRGNVNLTRSGDYCDINNLSSEDSASSLSSLGASFNYCGINKFNFAARTAGGS